MRTLSQRQMIAEHLRQKGSITPMDALGRYGCFRLAARIEELKKDGLEIQTELVHKDGLKYANYKLVS